MKLSAITPHLTATVKVSETDTLSFQFKQPTVALWRLITDIEKGEDKDTVVKQLALLVTDTGFEDEDGNKIPPTEESFRDLIPATLATRMLMAILESIGQYEKKLSSSLNDGSDTAEKDTAHSVPSRKSKSTN